jgi:hypothetical protein
MTIDVKRASRDILSLAVTPARFLLLAPPLLLAAFSGCTQDHSLLAPTSSSSGTGATAGNGASAGAAGNQGGQGGSTSTAGDAGAEPDGPTKLTIVNGIADYDAVRVCFIPYPAGGKGTAWPSATSNLGFARAKVVDPPTSLGPAGSDIQPFVIGGDLEAVAGKACDAVIALAQGGGGPVVVGAMPVIPASVFDSEKSLLLAFYGCLGGPGHDDSSATLGCGSSYTPETPTAGLTLVAMSRKTDPSSIALQFVHASVAMQPSDIRIAPGYEAAVEVPAANAIALGGLAPKPPFVGLPRVGFGMLTKAALRSFEPGQPSPMSSILMQQAFNLGGIKDTAFVDGSSFTFVAVGGYPGVVTQSFWQPFTYTMVVSDPP